MKRIGILTAGGDTPALNAAIHGAVVRANQLRIEIFGLIKGFNCLFNPRVPHVHLNPLFQEIPELDPTKGGTLIGSSRDYVDPEQEGRSRSHLRAPHEARHRRADRDRRRRHAQRAAAAGRTPADRARAQDDRQRSGVELPERARRMGARQGSRRDATATATSARRRTPSSISITSSTTRRRATPRPCSSPRRASSASGRRRKATGASRSSRSWAGTRATSRSAPAYGQPDIILVPEHPLDMRAARRAGQAPLRPSEERRHRLRRRHRGRGGQRAGRRVHVHRPGRQRRC